MELVVESFLLLTGWYLAEASGSARWLKHWSVPVLLIALQVVSLAGSISQRPYASRCLGFAARCVLRGLVDHRALGDDALLVSLHGPACDRRDAILS